MREKWCTPKPLKDKQCCIFKFCFDDTANNQWRFGILKPSSCFEMPQLESTFDLIGQERGIFDLFVGHTAALSRYPSDKVLCHRTTPACRVQEVVFGWVKLQACFHMIQAVKLWHHSPQLKSFFKGNRCKFGVGRQKAFHIQKKFFPAPI